MKTPSSTPGVFLVGPAGGKMRPWCAHCHKFLKSETAAHDCTPVNLSAARKSGSSSHGARKRIRLTPKTKATLNKVFEAAALAEDAMRVLNKLSKYGKKKSISGAKIAKIVKGASELSKRGNKRASSLKKRFL